MSRWPRTLVARWRRPTHGWPVPAVRAAPSPSFLGDTTGQYRRSMTDTPEETPEGALLVDEVRRALATGHPLDLLGMASLMVEATKPPPLAAFGRPDEQRPTVGLDDLIAGFVDMPIPETTALLAVLAELLVDD